MEDSTTFAGRTMHVNYATRVLTISDAGAGVLVFDTDKEYYFALREAWLDMNPVADVQSQLLIARGGWTLTLEAVTAGNDFFIDAFIHGRHVLHDTESGQISVTFGGVRFPDLVDQQYIDGANMIWDDSSPIRKVNDFVINVQKGWTVTDDTI